MNTAINQTAPASELELNVKLLIVMATTGEGFRVCPVLGIAKDPAIWLSPEAFDMLNAKQPGFGAEVTAKIKQIFYMHKLLEANRIEQNRVMTARFTDWLKKAGKLCLENDHAIISAFNQADEFKVTPDVGRQIMSALRISGVMKELVFAQHTVATVAWVKANGIKLETADAIKAIRAENGNEKLNPSMLNAAFLTERSRIKKLRQQTEEEMKNLKRDEEEWRRLNKEEEKTRLFELHLNAAKLHDDGKSNSHEMAVKIQELAPEANNFKMLVAAILNFRNGNKKNVASVDQTAYHQHLPNAFKSGIKNPGSAQRKSKEKSPATRLSAVPDQKQKKGQKGNKK